MNAGRMELQPLLQSLQWHVKMKGRWTGGLELDLS